MTYYISIIILGCILAGGLYHKSRQDKKQEIKTILQQYMVLNDDVSPEEHTTL